MLSGGVAATAALVYRWYGRTPIPEGVGVLLGVGSVALWLNTTASLAGAIDGSDALVEPATAFYTIGTIVVVGIAADLGRRAGDRFAADAASVAAGVTGSLDGDVSTLVRSVRRAIRVTLPAEIDDVEGYDSVDSNVCVDWALTGRTRSRPAARTERIQHWNRSATLPSPPAMSSGDGKLLFGDPPRFTHGVATVR